LNTFDTTDTPGAASVMLEEPPPPGLSFARVLVAILLVAAVAGTAAYAITRRAIPAVEVSAPAFAPYVDVTLTPTYAFQNPLANPVQRVVLGFVVADPSHRCAPSWGGYYSPSQAESALNLDQRVTQVRNQGGAPTLSFGGQANTELAVSCTSVPALSQAYQDVLQRYRVTTADFDIEGSAVADPAANTRRAMAVALAQHRIAAGGGQLRVWLTLPVASTGLTAAGIDVVRSMLAARAQLSGVNVLAMDFAVTHAVRTNMIGTVETALMRTHDQLAALDQRAGLDSGSAAVWSQIGVTVMIGQNDLAHEVFTVSDARSLAGFVEVHRVAQISIWSLNRDSECGSVFGEVGVVSNMCSGVSQTPLEFTHIFSRLPGTVTADTRATPVIPRITATAVDNPATSPDPVWQSTAAYPAGYTVVWHHAIYQAMWFAEGQAPDTPVSSAGQSPWLLLGPVLPGEPAAKPRLLASGVRHAWSITTAYRAGDRVLYSGLPFEAKWYSQGVAPDTNLPESSQSPWLPLFTIPGEPGS
jgi:chitinase